MIVPRYWSESKAKKIVNGQQFTVKRFGWSDISEEDAKDHADARLQEALEILLTEGDVRRIDHKTSYNGAEGIPIREEVISKYQDIVISRNSYGSLCLNTPDVLFADIDLEYRAPLKIHVTVSVLIFFCAAAAGLYFGSWTALFIGIFLASIFTSIIANLIYGIIQRLNGGFEENALKKIRQVSNNNPELNLRVYRTPMGFRVLFMNDTYSPTEDVTIGLLNALKSDRIYIRMCKKQNCFRARVSPKPWRIGIEYLKPRSGVWPIKEEKMGERLAWVELYQEKAENYSSCHYLMHLGSNKTDNKAEFARQIHDDLCKVNRNDLEIA